MKKLNVLKSMGKNWKILGNYKLSSREVTKYGWETAKKIWKSVGKMMKLLRKKKFFSLKSTENVQCLSLLLHRKLLQPEVKRIVAKATLGPGKIYICDFHLVFC